MTRGATPSIVKLENPIRHYAWGSTSAIALLQGRPVPASEPEAELWIGDHPGAPSSVRTVVGLERATLPLASWLSRDPDAVLGAAPRAHGDHLPFLTKVLAAAQPLSLQVHPDAEEARAGYAREEAAGTPSEQRCYRDPHPKHEVLVALSAFDALCGLRPDEEVCELVGETLSPLLRALLDDVERRAERARGDSTASRLFGRLLELAPESCRQLCRELAPESSNPDEAGRRDPRHWVARLCALHPNDALIAAPLLMNHVALAPGEAVVVPPGMLHTYLGGVGVEVMTPSDNVVRAGLSRKYVDVRELRRIASTRAGKILPLEPETSDDGAVSRYATGTPALDLSVVALDGRRARRELRTGGRVAVLLCVEGTADITSGIASGIALTSLEAALVPAAADRYMLSTGSTARIFVVQSGPA